jgi:hypothetical protein
VPQLDCRLRQVVHVLTRHLQAAAAAAAAGSVLQAAAHITHVSRVHEQRLPANPPHPFPTYTHTRPLGAPWGNLPACPTTCAAAAGECIGG